MASRKKSIQGEKEFHENLLHEDQSDKEQLPARAQVKEIAGEIQDGARLVGAEPPSEKEIEHFAQLLSLYSAPEITGSATERFLADLLPALSPDKSSAHSLSWISKVIVMQIRFFPLTFWLGAAFFVLLGLLITPHFRPGEINLMIAVIPWLGSLSIFFGLGQSRGTWGELESFTPLPAHLLAMGRTFAALGADMLVALAATGLAVFWGLDTSIWEFTVSWLVPLLLSTSLAFLLVLLFGTQKALAMSTIFWGIQVIAHQRMGIFSFLSFPGDPFWAINKSLGLLFAGFCLAAAYFYLKSPYYQEQQHYQR